MDSGKDGTGSPGHGSPGQRSGLSCCRCPYLEQSTSTRHVRSTPHPLCLFFEDAWRFFSSLTGYRNFCSACAVNVVVFGHFNRCFYLLILTYSQECKFTTSYNTVLSTSLSLLSKLLQYTLLHRRPLTNKSVVFSHDDDCDIILIDRVTLTFDLLTLNETNN